jgi:phage-related baseplate assembly protein
MLPNNPQIIEELSYEEIKAELVADLQHEDPSWQPHESDERMIQIGGFAYRELFLRQRINNGIKATLLSTAEKSDLDHVVWSYYGGLLRLQGSKPYAKYEFTLSAILDIDVTIPKGTQLISEDNQSQAFTMWDVVIDKGSQSVTVQVELNEYVANSDIKTEIIATQIPFLQATKSLENFKLGSDKETDQELRLRAIQSLARYSTAGSIDSYKFHTMTADEKVWDVSVLNGLKDIETYIPSFLGLNEDTSKIKQALTQIIRDFATVEVYVASKTLVDDIMIDRIKKALTDEKVRPLTDFVKVYKAIVKDINIKAVIYLKDMSQQSTIKNQINDNLIFDFKINDNITLSELNHKCFTQGVSSVEITSPLEDVITTQKEIISIKDISLEFKEVVS